MHDHIYDKVAGFKELLEEANTFRKIITVYKCADNDIMRKYAIDKLDEYASEWFDDINDEDLEYLVLNAPSGSETKKRAEMLHSARLGHY